MGCMWKVRRAWRPRYFAFLRRSKHYRWTRERGTTCSGPRRRRAYFTCSISPGTHSIVDGQASSLRPSSAIVNRNSDTRQSRTRWWRVRRRRMRWSHSSSPRRWSTSISRSSQIQRIWLTWTSGCSIPRRTCSLSSNQDLNLVTTTIYWRRRTRRW